MIPIPWNPNQPIESEGEGSAEYVAGLPAGTVQSTDWGVPVTDEEDATQQGLDIINMLGSLATQPATAAQIAASKVAQAQGASGVSNTQALVIAAALVAAIIWL